MKYERINAKGIKSQSVLFCVCVSGSNLKDVQIQSRLYGDELE